MVADAVEATHTVVVIAPRARQREALQCLEDQLEAAEYPTRDLNVHAFGPDAVQIEAVLTSTSVEGDLLDAVIARLSAQDCVTQAFWSPSTTE